MDRRVRPSRRIVGMLVPLAVLGVIPLTTAAAPVPASAPVPTLRWVDCGDGFECAKAAVPLDHRRPNRTSIDLDVIRRPALDQANRIGTLFIAHPHGTIDFVRGAPPGTFSCSPGSTSSVSTAVGMATTGVDCGIDEALLEPFSSNALRPSTIDHVAMIAAADEYARRCVEAHGDLLPHLTTAAMARDLDLLRAAVGDEHLTDLGISQGSELGATFAALFPGRVRAMVFDAPVDLAGWRRPPRRDRPRARGRLRAGARSLLHRLRDACRGVRVRWPRPGDRLRRPPRHARRNPDRTRPTRRIPGRCTATTFAWRRWRCCSTRAAGRASRPPWPHARAGDGACRRSSMVPSTTRPTSTRSSPTAP